ncbi:hypothetical protein ACMFMG_006797 [Clarireedia jacksonii]
MQHADQPNHFSCIPSNKAHHLNKCIWGAKVLSCQQFEEFCKSGNAADECKIMTSHQLHTFRIRQRCKRCHSKQLSKEASASKKIKETLDSISEIMTRWKEVEEKSVKWKEIERQVMAKKLANAAAAKDEKDGGMFKKAKVEILVEKSETNFRSFKLDDLTEETDEDLERLEAF